MLIRVGVKCIANGTSLLDLADDIGSDGIPDILDGVSFGTPITVLSAADGTIVCGTGLTPTPTPAPTDTLTVNKDFSDDSTASVNVTVTCTNGATPDQPTKSVTELSPAVFTISLPVGTAQCNAVEDPPPPGYIEDNSDCQNVPMTGSSTPSCTIFNGLRSTTFTISKDFSDVNGD